MYTDWQCSTGVYCVYHLLMAMVVVVVLSFDCTISVMGVSASGCGSKVTVECYTE